MSAAYRFARLAAACAAILWQVPPAQAATYYWTLSPPQTGNWSDPNNWGGTAPVAGDNAIIDNGGTANVTAAERLLATVYRWVIALAEAAPWYTTGGTMSGSVQYVGNAGTGTFTQSGGSNGGSSSLFLGYNSTGNGTYQLSGPAALSTNSQFVGYDGTGILSQSGGTNTVSSVRRISTWSYQSGSSGRTSSVAPASCRRRHMSVRPCRHGAVSANRRIEYEQLRRHRQRRPLRPRRRHARRHHRQLRRHLQPGRPSIAATARPSCWRAATVSSIFRRPT